LRISVLPEVQMRYFQAILLSILLLGSVGLFGGDGFASGNASGHPSGNASEKTLGHVDGNLGNASGNAQEIRSENRVEVSAVDGGVNPSKARLSTRPANVQEKEDLSGFPLATVIPVEGEVNPFMFTTIKRRTEEAVASGSNLIIYRVKSPGGQIGAALDMANHVFTLADNIHTIAFVEEQAYSAAALFCLACDDVAMAPGSAIGDCEPIMMQGGGYTTAGEKIQTVLKERFRTFSKANGYPVVLSEAMVTSSLEIYRTRRKETGELVHMRKADWEILGEEGQKAYETPSIAVHAGELLTLGSDEALEIGFSMGTYADEDEMVRALGYRQNLGVLELNRDERVVNTMGAYAGLLMAFGIFFLYLEFKTPGIGFFGALGAVCFAGFFISMFYEGQANYLEVMGFILGLGLIALEIFVFPGFGVAGLCGMALVIGSLILSMQDFVIPQGDFQVERFVNNLAMVSFSFMAASLALILLLWLGPRKGGEPGTLIHRDRQTGEVAPPLSSKVLNYKGKMGVATTPLLPGGKALLEDEEIPVVAVSGYIEKGEAIEVIDQQGNEIMVRKCSHKGAEEARFKEEST